MTEKLVMTMEEAANITGLTSSRTKPQKPLALPQPKLSPQPIQLILSPPPIASPDFDVHSAILGRPQMPNPIHTNCRSDPKGNFTFLFESNNWICQACGFQTGAGTRLPFPATARIPAL